MRHRLPVARRLLRRDSVRTGVTVVGVGVAVALPLLLFAVYDGARTEGNAWVASRPAAAWVMHPNSRNLVRSVSYLQADLGVGLETAPGVMRAAPLLRVIASTTVADQQVTFFVLGIDPNEPMTRPEVVEGRATPAPGELLLDRGLARRHGLVVGDSLGIQRLRFRIAGLTTGTNAVVTSFGFATLADAQALLGFEDIVSYFLIEPQPGVTPGVVTDTLRRRFDELNTFTADEFVGNNLEEMDSGVMPLLGAVTGFGAVSGAVVLTLLLYGAALERRSDYALVKAVGARQGWVERLVLRQALLVVGGGILVGFAIYGLALPVLRLAVPDLPAALGPGTAAATVFGAVVLGGLAALLPIRRLRRVHPGEVFRP